MNMTVYIVLLGWIPLVLALFAVLPPRRAVLISFIGGVLFLPCYSFKLLGIPDYGRSSATAMIAIVGIILFDSGSLLRFRPRLMDLPMAVFCLVPLVSSLHNGLGINDGASVVFHQVVDWGIPYFIGRLYFNSLEAHRELALGILIGGLIYVPLCLYESRMSPQLHTFVYGYHQHQFAQVFRFGGYRPVVFMDHGLAVALWMAIALVIGVWLWATRAVRTVATMPIGIVVSLMAITFILCRSLGALILAILAIGALYVARTMRLRLAVLLLAAVPIFYIADRLTGLDVVNRTAEIASSINKDRGGSLGARFSNERILIEKAMGEPLVGWGGWGRARVYDEEGNDISVTDGLWVIILGMHGLVGLAALLGWQLWPAVAMIRRIRPAALGSAEAAAPLALAVVLLMVAIDALPNAPAVSVYTMISGALVSLVSALRPGRVRPEAAIPQSFPVPAGAVPSPTSAPA